MSDEKDGGPAFPQTDLTAYGMGPAETNNGGMSLRDWFAGQALAGLMSNCTGDGLSTWLPESAAFRAYTIADAMLEARK
jgi:hypothetical protein